MPNKRSALVSLSETFGRPFSLLWLVRPTPLQSSHPRAPYTHPFGAPRAATVADGCQIQRPDISRAACLRVRRVRVIWQILLRLLVNVWCSADLIFFRHNRNSTPSLLADEDCGAQCSHPPPQIEPASAAYKYGVRPCGLNAKVSESASAATHARP